jgi:[ribosomal protein S5]-alanine N-acetyltransferase
MNTKFSAQQVRADVKIRALEPDDYSETIKWRRDEATWDMVISQKRFVSSETERAWVLNAIKDHEAGRILRFGITIGDQSRLVGLIIISYIDLINRSCKYGNLLSPDGYRGKGIAFAALLLVYRYLFAEWGMNRISGDILADNRASRKFAERFGKTQEGVLRQAVFKNGRFQDVIVYSMLREEFNERYGEWR